MNVPVVAVIVGAGLGTRFSSGVAKAALDLGGKPLVIRALEALTDGGATQAVVVLRDEVAAELADWWQTSSIPVQIVSGGPTRQDSVRCGVAAALQIPEVVNSFDETVVLIHDAARPLVPAKVVADVIAAVRSGASAVAPGIELADSVRQRSGNSWCSVNRESLRLVQTPQGFPATVIKQVSEFLAGKSAFTDDISGAEAAGFSVTLIPGDAAALKITRETDLLVARALLPESEKSN